MPINKRVQRMFKEYLKSLRPMKNFKKYLRVLDKLVLDYDQRRQLQEMIETNKLPKTIKIQLDHLHKIYDQIEILEEAADQFIQTEEEVDEEPTARPTKAKNVKQVIKPKTTKAKMTKPATRATTAKPATRATTAKPATRGANAKPPTRTANPKPATKAANAKPVTRAKTAMTVTKTKMPAKARGLVSHYKAKPTEAKTTTVEQRATRAMTAKAAQQTKNIKKVRKGAKV